MSYCAAEESKRASERGGETGGRDGTEGGCDCALRCGWHPHASSEGEQSARNASSPFVLGLEDYCRVLRSERCLFGSSRTLLAQFLSICCKLVQFFLFCDLVPEICVSGPFRNGFVNLWEQCGRRRQCDGE